MSQRARDLAVPVGVLAILVVLSLVAPAVLPSDVAVRFRPLSAPGGGLEGMGMVAWPRWVDMLVWPAYAALFVGLTAYLSPRVTGRGPAREMFAVAHSGALIVLVLRLVTFTASAGRPAASSARLDLPLVASPHAPYEILVFVVGALALSYLTAWLLSARPRPLAPAPIVLSPAPGHRGVVWTGRARLTWTAVVVATHPTWCLAGPMLVAIPQWWWFLVVWALFSLGSVRHLRVDVSIGAAGILVRTRPFGVRLAIPWEHVQSVDAIHTELRSVLPVQTRLRRHVLLRPGPALRIITTTDPPFTVTVDDAATGATVAHHHLQREPTVTGTTMR